MKTTLIWNKLLIDGSRIVESSKVREIARSLKKNEWGSLDYLQKHGYIYRILKGIYYVKNPEEKERDYFQLSIYEMISQALKLKGIKNWYFGLETALKINNMTHEYFTVNYVITDSYRTTKIIHVLDSKFKFFKWHKKYFIFGITAKNGLRYSDREKTVLELTYQRYLKSQDLNFILSPIIEYQDLVDKNKLVLYLEHYSNRFQKFLGEQL